MPAKAPARNGEPRPDRAEDAKNDAEIMASSFLKFNSTHRGQRISISRVAPRSWSGVVPPAWERYVGISAIPRGKVRRASGPVERCLLWASFRAHLSAAGRSDLLPARDLLQPNRRGG